MSDEIYQGKGSKKYETMESGTFNSSCLAAYEYDVLKEELTLTFTDGAVHVYTGISRPTVEALKRAPSAGKYFNAAIRIG